MRRDRLKLHLGLGAACVLGAGLALRPQAPTPVVTAPDERTAPLLREEIQRRDTLVMFGEVHRVSADVRASVVAFVAPASSQPIVLPDFAPLPDPPDRRRGLGLVVSADGEILSHVSVTNGEFEVEARLGDGRAARASVVAFERDTGLVLLRADTSGTTLAARLDGAPTPPGTILAGVSPGAAVGGPRARPVYVAGDAPDRLDLAAFSESLVPGAPLFTLSGAAVAVVGAEPHTAWSAPRALARLRALSGGGRGLPVTLGLHLQAVDDALRRAVGPVPVLVAGLDDNGPAARAGVRLGDGVYSIGGADISSVTGAIDAISSLQVEGPSEVVIGRDGARLAVLVTPEQTLGDPIVAPAPVPQPRVDSPSVERLFSKAAREAAALPEGASVLRIDNRPMTERSALAYLRKARRPCLLYLEHDGRRFFAAAEYRP